MGTFWELRPLEAPLPSAAALFFNDSRCEWGDSNPHGVTHWYLKPEWLSCFPSTAAPREAPISSQNGRSSTGPRWELANEGASDETSRLAR
jgi:hypothetical protein